jgi:phosphate transport system substrate-binding protein
MSSGVRAFVWVALVANLFAASRIVAQEQGKDVSVQEIRAILNSIDPYLPRAEVTGEVDVFGSTSMDAMAHGWAIAFKKFHPKAKVVVSAEGSETVFERFAQNPASVGMVSRPVTVEELAELKKVGLKKPVALMVAREALGVFVHKDNPLDAISYEELVKLFCKSQETAEPTWAALGLGDAYAKESVDVIGRDTDSGTRNFMERFLFHNQTLRPPHVVAESNSKVIEEVEKNSFAVAIGGLRAGAHDARPLHLRQDKTIIPSDDHAILVGNYPLTRPMTLIVDVGQTGEKSEASREYVRFALSQAGQMQAILAGFFPLDPPTLRAESAKVDEGARSAKDS